MGVTVFRPTDRITLKIGELTLKLAPLTFRQKAKLMSFTRNSGGEETTNGLEMIFQAIKYFIKDVDGLVDCEGNAIAVELDDNGELKEEYADMLLSADESPTLIQALTSFMVKISKDLTNPDTGEKIEGAQVFYPSDLTKKNS